MVSKVFHFVSGMPRSGSTLLCNILAQNPRFGATPTSGICPLLLQTNHAWNNISELRASATPEQKISTLRAMFDGYHHSIERQVVFNKSRGWVTAFELLENILERKPKILVTFRDIPSILSSCEKLFRKEIANPASTAQFGSNMATLEGRLAHWTALDQLVGSAYNNIRDCVTRGHRDSMFFVGFDDLTTRPEAVMRAVYEFLEIEEFKHNFGAVEQATHENDAEHGFIDLHTIRPKIEPVKKDFREVLGDAIRPYMNINYDFI